MITQIVYNVDAPMQNVTESLKGLEASVIRDHLMPKRSQVINVCMNFTSDFNKASALRASNAFLAKEFILVGNKKIDRRGTTGLHHLETVKHSPTLSEVVNQLHADGYTVFGVDSESALVSKSIYSVNLPAKSAFVYSEEHRGFSAEELETLDELVYTPQRNVSRTINTAQAAAVMLTEHARQHGVV